MYEGPVIDCDVHHNRASDADLLEYLPKEWLDYAALPGFGRLAPLSPGLLWFGGPGGTNKRLDTFPTEGPPGSDFELLKEQLLEPFKLEWALLSYDVGQEAAMPNVELGFALCQAMNDWTAERWLPLDDRLCAAIVVPSHFPDRAAAEIRRVAENPKFVSAMLPYNAFGQPLGHPVYDPIYAAAAEMGLPLHLHGTGEYIDAVTPHTSGGGPHSSRFDIYTMIYQALANHITSLIVQGVFERYPTLNILLPEAGLAWFPWLAASLESNYGLMKRESRWVRKPPSEYLREHVAVSTQPCEANPQDREAFVAHLSLVEGIEDMICYSSDYPHWDTDADTFIEAIFPKAWHEKIFHGNARRVLRLPTSSKVTREIAQAPA
jgi:predicted TIM-barrel fold metal-dependent hydrolase